ncbi:MAG: hypothetical protein MRY32_08370 [Rickettsiales bacterium]|nr:hypothetical protein [Rickettsiales bacterium]
MASPSQDRSTTWGKMFETGKAAVKVTLAAFAFAFVSLVLYHFGVNVYENDIAGTGFGDAMSEAWKSGVSATQSVWGSIEGFFSDVTSAGGTPSDTWSWMQEQWQKPWVKAGTVISGLGIGAIMINEAGKEPARRPQPQPAVQTYRPRPTRCNQLPPLPSATASQDEFRALKQRLDAARAQERGLA